MLTIDVHLGNQQLAAKKVVEHRCSGNALSTRGFLWRPSTLLSRVTGVAIPRCAHSVFNLTQSPAWHVGKRTARLEVSIPRFCPPARSGTGEFVGMMLYRPAHQILPKAGA